MKSQNALFLVFCLSLTVGLLAAFNIFTAHFNGHQQYEARLESAQSNLQQEKFHNTLLVHQLKDFQQTVAQVLPDNQKLQAQFQLKNWASVVRVPASVDYLDLSGALFEKGKKNFAGQEYDKAIRDFNRLLKEYPLSQHTVEARFFVAESYFLKKDFRESLSQIDEMVSQYPDNDLTGFILLRMGQISEYNSQTEEASEIYKTVLKNFKSEELREQAKKLAKNIEYK
jgi:tetratricopeptide (TPR) repeat protein